MKKFLTILILSTLILCACSFEQDVENKNDRNASTKTTGNEQQKKEVINGRTYYDGILIVNKTTKLPSDYNPGEKPKAQRALQQMFTDAERDGVSLYKISGFRSYETQVNLYNQYVARDGEENADRYSARPGTSEHQSGLSYDVGAIGSDANLRECFGATKEGQWIARNAHRYGFIVRYPKGKEQITGYQYEPWHLRYLGKNNATKVQHSGQSLEEYVKYKDRSES
ncbi:M15 family metallopeptidase [Staphylococcus haemolyticus]|uniref:M15 family metallopeptidase n=1 Tax=Staphylococcus TaxID=1279 RepID=UPI00069F7AE7|nr:MULTISPECIES: M15 family metallopeptidase [Staphylococcus]KAA2275722.1 M15 family metallopeptidase [Staphylococcus sp. GDX7P312P]KAA2282244.1 M15 family metallopeptidase [Staphylococcus sp. GDX7P459A]MCE4953674.1 M15 family metallopeptidase [Staphylococcus haemolyticus]PTK85931.1 D-alanyl-D-alanine carboxypeptidase family protein [Staphylococcus haemolyticus]PTL05154.1 D-alanyl-D-alanine carboxypeptidase family protein [Staphylococcus haemolyticus]